MARYDEPVEAEPERMPLHEEVSHLRKQLNELFETVAELSASLDRMRKQVSRELGY